MGGRDSFAHVLGRGRTGRDPQAIQRLEASALARQEIHGRHSERYAGFFWLACSDRDREPQLLAPELAQALERRLTRALSSELAAYDRAPSARVAQRIAARIGCEVALELAAETCAAEGLPALERVLGRALVDRYSRLCRRIGVEPRLELDADGWRRALEPYRPDGRQNYSLGSLVRTKHQIETWYALVRSQGLAAAGFKPFDEPAS